MSFNAYNRVDLSTYSNYNEVISISFHLDWLLDFQSNTITGSVTHKMKTTSKLLSSLIKFDSSNLNIIKVEINNNQSNFNIGETSTTLGTCIQVQLPNNIKNNEEFEVKFYYTTSPNATALQWLSNKATSSGNYPFVFTQCQAIHARSLFPCQDSPGVKTPYSAVVRAPTWATVLMSALDVTPENAPKGEFHWNQPVPTPAYLVALAAGELESRTISERVKVWAEPSVVEAAAYEFSQTEEFLATAESLTCPYAWGRYDVLCLPPSFPYGGMENPCLTFATPTLLAGDKSLADVIAHEIAHSWTGNLVTNCTWEHFWLNEGWTVWLERKIMSRVKKNPDFIKLSAEIGWKALVDSVDQLESGKFTKLVWPLGKEDPDDAFSSVPYEKGFNLLYQLESLVGTLPFEEFAKKYINTFKFGVVSSGEFKDFFLSTFQGNPAVDSLDWDKLFYDTGLPAHTPNFSNPLSANVYVLADQWIEIFREKANVVQPVGDMTGWSSQQKCIFLERLLFFSKENGPLSLPILNNLDLAYEFTSSKNSEIRFRWQSLCLESEADWIVPHVVNFVKSQGRMKFVRPLYRSLHQSAVGSAIARETFIQNNEIYHPIARKMIAHDLGVTLPVTSSSSSTVPPKASSSTVAPIKASEPAPEESSHSFPWVPLTFVALGVVAAFAINRNK